MKKQQRFNIQAILNPQGKNTLHVHISGVVYPDDGMYYEGKTLIDPDYLEYDIDVIQQDGNNLLDVFRYDDESMTGTFANEVKDAVVKYLIESVFGCQNSATKPMINPQVVDHELQIATALS